MSDRLQEIRVRLDAIAAWRLREEPEVFTQNVDATFRQWAPHDIAWLLDEVERLRNTKASLPNPLCDESVVQGVTKRERP